MYVCDLVTGEMVNMDTLLSPHYAEMISAGEGASFSTWGYYWASDDTLVGWVYVSTAPENVDTDSAIAASSDSIPWLFSYNFSTGRLNYCLEDIAESLSIYDGNQPYISYFADEEGYPFQVIDSIGGKVYRVNASFGNLAIPFWDSIDPCTLLYSDDKVLYFVDASKASWINLGDYLVLPDDPIETLWMVTEDWFCLSTGQQVFCYHVPEDVEWTPLEQYAP